MAGPTSRDEFKAYIFRRLGAPVIEVNVEDDQVNERIDDAIKYWQDYHYDGQTKQYYKYGPVSQTDVTNRYITLPENIIGAVSIFPIGMSLSTNNLFNIRYQIALNDLYDLTATTMVPYYMAMQHVQFLEQMLVGNQPIRFERHSNRLYIDMDWHKVVIGEYLVIEAFGVVDPDIYNNAWGDRWLQRYATALVKKQWGLHLIKYKGVNLPGGQQFNGEKLYDDADKEIEKLEDEMQNSYVMPPSIFIG